MTRTTEDVLRTKMAAADTAPVRPFDLERLERRKRATTLARAGTVAGVALAVLAVAVVTTSAVRHRATPAAPIASCPEAAHGIWTPAHGAAVPPGPADVMVPEGATSLLVCDYEQRQPYAAATLAADDPSAQHLIDTLNALPEPPPLRQPECLNDTGDSFYLVVFEYADSPDVVVDANNGGCYSVSNGTRKATLTPPEVRELIKAALAS